MPFTFMFKDETYQFYGVCGPVVDWTPGATAIFDDDYGKHTYTATDVVGVWRRPRSLVRHEYIDPDDGDE